MGLIDELAALNCNTQEAEKRFMNNTSLYVKMLKKFPAAAEETPVMPLIESGDLEAAAAAAHTLKGVTGNLSLTPLYEAYTEIVTALRNSDGEKARKMLEEIIPVQEKILSCINNS